MRHAALSFLLLLAMQEAMAEAPIYRCGAPGSRVYSQKPCPEGQLIDSADPRSAAQRAEAQTVAARERRMAADLERERRRQQAAQTPAEVTGINGRPAPVEPVVSKHEVGSKKKKHSKAKAKAKTEDFVAVEPGKPKGSRP